jgi:riboflavin biosynthesis protein RibD
VTPEELMSRAIAQAQTTDRYKVRPNPRVGAALLTTGGQIFEAAHERYGEEHAEIIAIQRALDAGQSVVGASLAVTLEPCSHQGRQPPCADRLVKEQIAKVFVGSLDPNSLVNGQGVARLLDARVSVTVGVSEIECLGLNREWIFAQRMRRPYVHLKVATSADGFMSRTDGKRWISSDEARAEGLLLRGRVDGFITTTQTVIDDNPWLTARGVQGQNLESQPFVFVMGNRTLDLPSLRLAQHPNPVTCLPRMMPEALLKKLFKDHQIASVLVEAGPKMTELFLVEKIYEEFHQYRSDEVLGAYGAHPLSLEEL